MAALVYDTTSDTLPAHLHKKKTIIKPRVGVVKTSSFELPADDFVYGRENNMVHNGAGEVLGNWVTSNPSAVKVSRNMVVAQNILAIKNG